MSKVIAGLLFSWDSLKRYSGTCLLSGLKITNDVTIFECKGILIPTHCKASAYWYLSTHKLARKAYIAKQVECFNARNDGRFG